MSSDEPTDLADLLDAVLSWRRTFIASRPEGGREVYGSTGEAIDAEAALLNTAERFADAAFAERPVGLPQCEGDCGDDCKLCGLGLYATASDDCRSYMAEDAERVS